MRTNVIIIEKTSSRVPFILISIRKILTDSASGILKLNILRITASKRKSIN